MSVYLLEGAHPGWADLLHYVFYAGVFRLLLLRSARIRRRKGDEVGVSRQEEKRNLEQG